MSQPGKLTICNTYIDQYVTKKRQLDNETSYLIEYNMRNNQKNISVSSMLLVLPV